MCYVPVHLISISEESLSYRYQQAVALIFQYNIIYLILASISYGFLLYTINNYLLVVTFSYVMSVPLRI